MSTNVIEAGAPASLGAVPYLRPAEMPARRGEVPSLDGLRAGSILLVMCSHFIDAHLLPGGFGVLVFFVISGFLITRLLLAEHKRTGSIDLGSFYIRRLLRLYPVVLAFVGAVFLFALANGLPYSYSELSSAIFYYSNYYFAMGSIDDETSFLPVAIFWSLAVEEHFYVVFPLVLMLCGARAGRLLAAMVAVIVGALALRLVVAHLHPALVDTHYFYRRSEMRMDSLGTGVLIAALCEIPWGRRWLLAASRPAAVGLALALLVGGFAIRDPWFRETFRYTMLNTSVAMLLCAVLFSDRYRPINRLLNQPALVWVGRLSYSLYVWHFGVSFVLPAHDLAFWPRAALYFALSFAAAIVSYLAIERPFMALRHRFGSVRREPAEVPL